MSANASRLTSLHLSIKFAAKRGRTDLALAAYHLRLENLNNSVTGGVVERALLQVTKAQLG
jgi:hypothetical protein